MHPILLAEAGGTALWAVLLGEGAPLVAALLVSVVLARSRFHEKLSEYRQDTLALVQMRAETMEKQLAETKGELEELRREARRRERHIEYLEMELEGHRSARGAPRLAQWAEDEDDEEPASPPQPPPHKGAHRHKGGEE